MIKLENDQGGLFHRSSDWFVDRVLISSSVSASKVYEFPCNAWVKRESVFFEGKGAVKPHSKYYKLNFLYFTPRAQEDHQGHQTSRNK